MYDDGAGQRSPTFLPPPAQPSSRSNYRPSPYADSRPLPPPGYAQPYYVGPPPPPGFPAPYAYGPPPHSAPYPPLQPYSPLGCGNGHGPPPPIPSGMPAYAYPSVLGPYEPEASHYPSSAWPTPAPLGPSALQSRASGFPTAPLPQHGGSASGRSGEERDVRTKRQYRKKTPPSACAACGASDTPEWRKGPTGNRTLYVVLVSSFIVVPS